MVPKLKYKHSYLKTFSKIRVDLAAQVTMCVCLCCACVLCIYMCLCMHVCMCRFLSNTVSKAMETMGKTETEETARFVQILLSV